MRIYKESGQTQLDRFTTTDLYIILITIMIKFKT